MEKAVRDYLGKLGRKGGKSKSDKKLEALKLNRARWSVIAKERRDEKA
jgi:hypothetical protein